MNPCIFSILNQRLDILINLIFLVGLQELQEVGSNINLSLDELNPFCWLYVKSKGHYTLASVYSCGCSLTQGERWQIRL